MTTQPVACDQPLFHSIIVGVTPSTGGSGQTVGGIGWDTHGGAPGGIGAPGGWI